jgi:hypothetical protein
LPPWLHKPQRTQAPQPTGESALGITIPGVVNPEPPAPSPEPDPIVAAVTGAAEPPKERIRHPAVFYGALGAAVLVVAAATVFLATRAAREPVASPGPAKGISAQTTAPTASPRPRIAPAGAPYSFALPEGFTQSPIPNAARAGQSGIHETAITPPGATGGDIIALSVYRLGADSDQFSFAQLQAEIDPLAAKVAGDPGAAQQLRVAGRRALRYVFDYGSTKVMSYFVFSGRIEVQVRCQWTRQRATIEPGCASVIASLTINN